MAINPWEIWWAEVEYEGHDGSKGRPVLVIEPGKYVVLSYKITSHEARNVWGEYEIIKWQSAGLKKPSVIRMTKPLELPITSFRNKIGELQPIDIEAINAMI